MITLDTHVIIWDALKPELITQKAKRVIDNANKTSGIIISEISLWEIAMLIKKKRVQIETSYIEFINLIKASNNYIFKGINPEIAELSTTLPREINLDPADRIICATSIITNTSLVTADKNLKKTKVVNTIW